MARLTLIARYEEGIGYVPVSVIEDHIYSKDSCSCGENRFSVFSGKYEFEFHGKAEPLYEGI